MNPSDAHLLNLFFGLRDDLGLPLQVGDYELLVDAWEKGFQPETYDELRALCQRLWIKSPTDRQRFRDYFDAYIADYLTTLQEDLEERIAAQNSTLEGTPETRLESTVNIPQPSRKKPHPPTASPQQRGYRPKLQVVQAVPRSTPKSERVPIGAYSLSDEYFPVKRRELQHGWRLLKQRERSGYSEEWDIPATIERIGKQGTFLNDPIYKSAYRDRTDLVLLVDRSNSMAPFDLMAERLISTAQRAKDHRELSRIQAYYFRNYSEGKLFADADMRQDPVWIDELALDLSEAHTIAVIFSDGGAARRGFSLKRWTATVDFVESFRSTVRQIAWLNPLPVDRWQGTTAAAIAESVPMFALDLAGWRNLLKDLRGRGQQSRQEEIPELEPKQQHNSRGLKNLRRQLQWMAATASNPDIYELAIEQMLHWAQRGKGALELLAHAAFPLALTPDLLYYLQENFVPDTSWVWGADLLLSSQSRTIGYHLYELDPHIRHLALKWLVQQERFGQSRLFQLSDSLLFYVQHRLEGTTRQARDFGEYPEWIALAYTEPNELASQIAQQLGQALPDDAVVRLASLVSTLAEPIAEAKLKPLLDLEYLVRGMGRYARGDETGAYELLDKIPTHQREVVVGDIRLPIPGREAAASMPELKTFEFEVARISVGDNSAMPEEEELAEYPEYPILLKSFESATVRVNADGQVVERIQNTVSGFVEYLTPPPKVFICSSGDDEDFRRQLEEHLARLQRQKKIHIWSDRALEVGAEWEAIIREQLESADIILLLITPRFLASDYCYGEMQLAVERHAEGSTRVIPLIIRPCDWQGTPFGHLQVLPPDGQPIATHDDQDTAFLNIVSSLYLEAEQIREDGATLDMVHIPEGTFMMGSSKRESGRFDNESPRHQVTVSEFFMSRYPITQAQWRAVARLPQVDRELNPDPSNFKGDNRPVERVSWHDAVEFCARLSQATGRDYRLPSEAEWEYACRADTTTAYAFGDTITHELANYYGGDRPNETTSVGTFPPNTFGLYDMQGNVWEWCQDSWHGDYKGAPIDGSAWIEEGEGDRPRVLRGGSWFDYPWYCRSACRYNGNPDTRNLYYGFRVVCSAARSLP